MTNGREISVETETYYLTIRKAFFVQPLVTVSEAALQPQNKVQETHDLSKLKPTPSITPNPPSLITPERPTLRSSERTSLC